MYYKNTQLYHSGSKGMKWGYNNGKRNGKRTAEEELADAQDEERAASARRSLSYVAAHDTYENIWKARDMDTVNKRSDLYRKQVDDYLKADKEYQAAKEKVEKLKEANSPLNQVKKFIDNGISFVKNLFGWK